MQDKETIEKMTEYIQSTPEYKLGESIKEMYKDTPVIDGRDKPIDLGDMPEDMNIELTKVAIFEIVELVLQKYEDDDIHKKSVRHNVANSIFNAIINEGFVYKIIDKEEKSERCSGNDKSN